ncbi:MAG: glycerophosphodiester phosphodiesterase family protein [Bdellovibrionota bacterium]
MSIIQPLILKALHCRPWPKQSFTLPKIQSHRGLCISSIQENTLDSFRAAKQKGAEMVECDLRLSRDGVPVVCHDETIERISGKVGVVSDMTAKELKLQANIPTLEQCLTDQSTPNFWNLEIKSSFFLNEELEQKVAEVVYKVNANRRVIISSFNPGSISRMEEFLPNVPRALLVTQEDHPKNRIWLKEMWAAPFLSFHMLNLDYRMVDGEIYRKLMEKQIKFAVWTVNGKTEVSKYLRLGAASIISDDWLN